MDNNNLKHAVINQIKSDLGAKEFDSLDELLERLMCNAEAKGILISFLSGSALENANLGLTFKRY